MREDAIDELASHLGCALREVVQCGNDGEYSGTGIRGKLHVAQMNAVEGCFADAEDETAALLQADVSGTLNQVVCKAICNPGKGSHRAR